VHGTSWSGVVRNFGPAGSGVRPRGVSRVAARRVGCGRSRGGEEPVGPRHRRLISRPSPRSGSARRVTRIASSRRVRPAGREMAGLTTERACAERGRPRGWWADVRDVVRRPRGRGSADASWCAPSGRGGPTRCLRPRRRAGGCAPSCGGLRPTASLTMTPASSPCSPTSSSPRTTPSDRAGSGGRRRGGISARAAWA